MAEPRPQWREGIGLVLKSTDGNAHGFILPS